MILQRDIRTPPLQAERRLQGHRQEVCGLKWSTDHQLLASGGNDNKVGASGPCPAGLRLCLPPQGTARRVLPRRGGGAGRSSGASRPLPPQLLVWNHSSLSPVQQYTEHLAAVKAIAWSPHQHGLLASGGGTADRCIRFWNTLTGQPLQCIDTGSQVCNLAWSKHANELVSEYGTPSGFRAQGSGSSDGSDGSVRPSPERGEQGPSPAASAPCPANPGWLRGGCATPLASEPRGRRRGA